MSLLYLTVHLWEWWYLHHVFPVANHISTTENQLADELSHLTGQSHEWELDEDIFQRLCNRWDLPCVDMFASVTNKKCNRYASRAGMGARSLGDSFMIPWQANLLYLFPPVPLIQRALVRMRPVRAQAIFIAPWLPRQPWFSTLKEMDVGVLKLPMSPHLLTQDSGNILHPDLQSLHLTAWRISH